MPLLSSETVKVLPVSSRTSMTLAEIRDALAVRAPDHSTYTGGWASTENAGSNLGGTNLAPPASEPELLPAAGGYPEMIRARYYYWTTPPVGVALPNVDPNQFRRLQALDLIITSVAADRISILVSSRNRQLVHRRDGALSALESVLQDRDASIRIDRRTSAVPLQDSDIFLWLAVRTRDNRDLTPNLRLDLVSGISGKDASSRTADLRAGVDFTRPNFLTAVAEADTLGPIQISFVHTTVSGRSSFGVMLHVDGGFEIHKRDITYPEVMGTEDLMNRASMELAFILIPLINQLYRDDDRWPDRRIEVIQGAIEELRSRYDSARAALRDRLEASPGTPAPTPSTSN